jgi:Pyruvate/2-oxoacid:ferredoxin oxidoreductase delta subunit
MIRLFRPLGARRNVRGVVATTYCEGCGGVCTPDCRREALRERQHEAVRRATLFRV